MRNAIAFRLETIFVANKVQWDEITIGGTVMAMLNSSYWNCENPRRIDYFSADWISETANLLNDHGLAPK